MGGLSEAIAEFVVDSKWDDIPPIVRAHATRCVFNGFGTALGGSADPAISRMLAALTPFSGAAAATVIGHRDRLDAPTAAFINAAATNVHDFDDSHDGTISHPTAPVMPAALALAETMSLSGADVLHAFILGVEVTCRLGNAISPGHYARGFHITSTCGIYGAAMAAAKLLKLGKAETLNALGIASSQSSGLVETLGYMAKSAGVGAAARNGLLAALMSRAGVDGPPAPLEGERGFLAVTCDMPNRARALAGLGTEWEILRNMIKPYPCGVVLNPVIDACLKGRSRLADVGEIAEIRLQGHPLLKARTDRPWITSGREAQVSAHHAVAVSLIRGLAGAADFSDAVVADPAIAALREKVIAVDSDPSMPVESAEIRIVLRNGDTLTLVENNATGSIGNPMGDDALKTKFGTLAAHGCPSIDAGALAEALWAFEQTEDVSSVLRLARPTSSSSIG
jgi:2-methylcitrate dehydratase PrpD